MATPSPLVKFRAFDANGNPLAGGKLYSYVAGSSTPKATYSDQSGTTPNPNPVVLNSSGEADVWLSGDYKLVLKDSNEITQWSVDNIQDGQSYANSVYLALADDGGSNLIGFIQNGAGAIQRTLQDKEREYVTITDFVGADKTGVTGSSSAFNAAIASLPSAGGDVIVPPGTWLIDALVGLKDNVRLIGVGMPKLVRGFTGSPMIRCGGPGNTPINHFEVSGFEMDGRRSTYGSGDCIFVCGNYGRVTANYLHDSPAHGVGIDGQTAGGASGNLIAFNRIVNCAYIGISQHTAPDNAICWNIVTGCGWEAVTVDVTSYRCRVIGNWLVTNCLTGGCGQIGIDKSDLSVISGNYIDGNNKVNIPGICFNNAAGTTNYVAVTGNVIINCDIAAVWMKHLASAGSGDPGFYSSANNGVTGNIFRNCPLGVRIDPTCNDNKIIGNTGGLNNTDSGLRNSVEGILNQWFLKHSVAIASVSGDGTYVDIPYDTTSQSNGSNLTISGGVVTCNKTGYYLLTATAKVDVGAATSFATLQITPSTGPVISFETSFLAAYVGGSVGLSASGVVKLNAGETVRVKFRVGGAASKNSGLSNAINANTFTGVLFDSN